MNRLWIAALLFSTAVDLVAAYYLIRQFSEEG